MLADSVFGNLISDEGFESDNPDGTFPSSGYWTSSWYPVESGAIVTTTAKYSGNNGLWAYTASTAFNALSQIYQEFSAHQGDIFTAGAFIKTPTGQNWASGSFACVRVEFLSLTNSVISYTESRRLTSSNTDWQNYNITSAAAPAGTAKVRFRLYLEKPSAGVAAQSIANFDDAYLEKINSSSSNLYLPKSVIGIRKDESSKSFIIKNTGSARLNFTLKESINWLSLSRMNGSIEASNETEINISISREYCLTDTCVGVIYLTSNGGNEDILVYLEMDRQQVPNQPSVVYVNGSRLIVQSRLTDGLLDNPVYYVIKGASWTPSSIGTPSYYFDRRREPRNWYVADIQLLKLMNVNTIYTFFDFFSDISNGTEILDYLYKNRIMVIMTVDEDGTNNLANIAKVVSAYKNHPAILMWAIGNEWNINYYHDKFGDHNSPSAAKLDASAAATEQAAQLIKSIDPNHPVASIYGEIDIPGNGQPLTKTQDIVNNICRSVDVWGVNIYRGNTFGTLFNQWKSITSKPMFLSEYGTDSYYTQSFYPVVGYEDETMQADWNHGLWQDMLSHLTIYDDSDICLGGTIFQFNDEWWKVKAADGGNEYTHDNGGYNTWWNPNAFPDGFGNEEYYGIISIEREPKESFYNFRIDYQNVSNVVLEPESCIFPYDDMIITKDTVFCKGIYNLPSGVWIQANNILLDCNGSLLNGTSGNWTNPYVGIYMEYTKNVTVKNCYVQNYGYAVAFINSSSNRIINNNVSNVAYGVYIVGSNNSIISDNTIDTTNQFGVYFSSAGATYNATVKNNVVTRSSYVGINTLCYNSTIIFNDLRDNRFGIAVQALDNNISYNTISKSTECGMRFWLFPMRHYSSYNYIYDNNAGVCFTSNSNRIFFTHNTIINNTKGILFDKNSYNNTLYENRICGNSEYDIMSNNTNFGFNNTCSKSFNWTENQNPGCTYQCSSEVNKSAFITVNGTEFFINEKPFYFAGANNYYLRYGDKDCIAYNPDSGCSREVFDDAQAMNLSVIRTWGFTDGYYYWGSLQPYPGEYDEYNFRKMDLLIRESSDRGIKLIIPLVNNWPEYGGMCQYVGWCNITEYCNPSSDSGAHDMFYTNSCAKDLYKKYIEFVLNRTNTLTGIKYKEDPNIFAWELANEPRAKSDPSGIILDSWIEEMSAYIKSIDNNHLVSTGSEGFYNSDGMDFIKNHNHTNIDFASFHLYPDWWSLSLEQSLDFIEQRINDSHNILGKPVIMGEFNKRLPERDIYMQAWYNISKSDGLNGNLFWELIDHRYIYDPDFGVNYPEDSTPSRIIDNADYWKKYNNLISPSNNAPEIEPIGNMVISEGEIIKIEAKAVDKDNDYISYYINDAYHFNKNGSVFTWKTYSGDEGNYNIIITASDGAAESSASFNITVLSSDACIIPEDGMIITNDTLLCAGSYNLPEGLVVGSNAVLDCNGSRIIGGDNYQKQGITIGGQNITIKNCLISNYYKCIQFIQASNALIIDNEISSCYHGINMQDSNNNNIIDNQFTNNWDIAIYGYRSAGSIILDNNFTYNGKGVYFDGCSNDIINGNYFYGHAAGSVYLLSNSNNNSCSNNQMIENGFAWSQEGGVLTQYSNNNIISNNDISENYIGIRIVMGLLNNISNNKLSGNRYNFGIFGYNDHIGTFMNYIDISNTINNKQVMYLINQKDIVLGSNYSVIGIVNSTNITISSINESNNVDGIVIAYSSDSSVKNSRFSLNKDDGIRIIRSENINVINSTVDVKLNYGTGIDLDNSNGTVLDNNKIYCNDFYGCTSLRLYYSSGSYLRNNNMYNSFLTFYVYSDYIEDYNHDIDTTNKINNKPIYYYFGKNDFSLRDVDPALVVFAGSDNIDVSNIGFKNEEYMKLAFVNNSNIHDCDFDGSNSNLEMKYSNYNHIFNNTIQNTKNVEAIAMRSSDMNTIDNNKLFLNYYGMGLSDSDNNNISNNYIHSNYEGIQLYFSYQNLIRFNTITNISGNGINMYESESYVDHNNIYSNRINLLINSNYNASGDNNWWGSIYCDEINQNISDCKDLGNSYGCLNYNTVLDAPYPSGKPVVCLKGLGIRLSQGWNLFSIKSEQGSGADKSTQLNKGWNLFGYSSEQPFNWSDALIDNGTEQKSITEAASLNWIQQIIYYFNETGQNYEIIPGNDDYLRLNKGYWLYSLQDGLTLIFPNAVSDDSLYYWLNATVTKDYETKSIEEAQDSNWLQGTIYYYDKTYKFVPDDDENIHPWIGYWLYSNENLTLSLG